MSQYKLYYYYLISTPNAVVGALFSSTLNVYEGICGFT